MRISNVFRGSFVVAALITGSLSVAGPAAAITEPPPAPPGKATVLTFYAGPHSGDIVGQMSYGGTCTPVVQWGITTIYYTAGFWSCNLDTAQHPAATPMSPPKGGAQQITYYSDANKTTVVGQRFSTSSSPCPSPWGITTSYYTVVGIPCP